MGGAGRRCAGGDNCQFLPAGMIPVVARFRRQPAGMRRKNEKMVGLELVDSRVRLADERATDEIEWGRSETSLIYRAAMNWLTAHHHRHVFTVTGTNTPWVQYKL